MNARTSSRSHEELLQRGNALREQGCYREAEPELRQALVLCERQFGKCHLQTAIALNSLGVLYKYAGRFAEADRVYRRALRIVERQVASNSAASDFIDFLASLYHNLGGLAHARGQFRKGESLARRSIEWRRRVRAAGDPVLAADQAALAALLDGQAKYDEAERLYLRVLKVFERHYGPVHYEVCITLNNLAAQYHLRGKLARAEAFYRRALAIKEELLGRGHPDTAVTLHNLAMLLQESEKHAEAGRCFRRALSIFRKTLPLQHPKLLAAAEAFQQLHDRRRKAST